jgi:hypothetical protein
MSVRSGPFVRWIAIGLLLGLGPLGCSASTSKVRGKVTHAGKTVVWGTVTLVDKTGQFHQADIDLEGNYEIENVPVGTVKIAVVSPNPNPPGRGGSGKGDGRGDAKGGGGGGLPGFDDPREKFLAGKEKANAGRPKPPDGAWFAIPPKFNTPEESGLTGEVKGKETVLNIELK